MIGANIHKIVEEIPPNVNLVAVSKTKPISMLQDAYNGGQRAFGENKVKEMIAKHEALPKDIEWHFIGHLQSNKVKYIAPFVHLIQSVDSLKLLEVINKEGIKNNRVINCLLQFHIAHEETKFGLDLIEATLLLKSDSFKQMKNCNIRGIMGMASFTTDENQLRKEFRLLKSFADVVKLESGNSECNILSFGMSGDYKIAIDEGSNMIRVGSTIFGGR